ncbi:hypothetical protein D3C81_2249050 [compost metagenome]
MSLFRQVFRDLVGGRVASSRVGNENPVVDCHQARVAAQRLVLGAGLQFGDLNHFNSLAVG